MSVKIRRVTLATFLATDAGVTAFPAAAEALAAAVDARRSDPEARLAVHTGEARREGERARTRRLRRDRQPRADARLRGGRGGSPGAA